MAATSPRFYCQHEGAVLSTAIDKFVHIVVNPTPNQGLKLMYSKIEQTTHIEGVEHPLIRETLKMFGVSSGLEIGSFAEIPTTGTGLGSSSPFTIGLIRAMSELCGHRMSRHETAEAACEIEIERCGEPIGKQDQYAAAFGGLNFMQFTPGGRVEVAPVNVKADRLNQFRERMLMFVTGRRRQASEILRQQSENVRSDSGKTRATLRLLQVARQGYAALVNGQLDDIGELFHESRQVKKGLAAGISDRMIEDVYNRARAAGALGGKMLGAGGGIHSALCTPGQSRVRSPSAQAHGSEPVIEKPLMTECLNSVPDLT